MADIVMVAVTWITVLGEITGRMYGL
jgi:hypothetical protein